MQIQVRTSINVRSNTLPSSPAEYRNEFPPPKDNKKVLEKTRSKSPIPFLLPLQDMAVSRFKASQRPPPGSRLSAWFHGFSVMDNNRRRTNTHNRNVSRTDTYCHHQTPRRRSFEHATGRRPAASTRGVLDPEHSPATNVWHIPPPPPVRDTRFSVYPIASSHVNQIHGHGQSSRQPVKLRQEKSDPRPVHPKQGRACFPSIKDPKIRQKAIGCLFFGIILTTVLTIYLALATSNTAWGTSFHGAFIFCILVLTLVFSHFLIRLCMLCFGPRKPHRTRKVRRRARRISPSDEETPLAQPTEPIPIVLAADEEPGRRDETPRNGFEEDDDSEKELPAPPPIYGNWRGSVRADPDLIHWQLHNHQPDLQREARELIFAGSGHRPPSYESNETTESVVASPSPARPLPLFAERRRAAGLVLP
ncbi:hypothetical protein ACLMJK_008445 [Lecanora helva]